MNQLERYDLDLMKQAAFIEHNSHELYGGVPDVDETVGRLFGANPRK